MEGKKVLNAFESGIFQKGNQVKGLTSILDGVAGATKVSDRNQLKILTPKKLLQRLPIALAQVKALTTSENLLNKFRQIIYSFHREKEITKKVDNNIINLISYKTEWVLYVFEFWKR